MKKLLSPLLFICFVAGGCKVKNVPTIRYVLNPIIDSAETIKPPAIYHIKASYFGVDMYQVAFTNDNWVTSIPIKCQEIGWEITNNDADSFVLSYDTKIFGSMYDAVCLAKTLRTFNDCIKYNSQSKSEYIKQNIYMQQHPKVIYPPHPIPSRQIY